MPAQRKLLIVAVVVVVGVTAAFLFRKPAAPAGADAATTPTNATGRLETAQPVDKPAPVSHLTGRIDPPDAANAERGTVAPATSDRGFGLSTMPPAGGYSALRPLNDEQTPGAGNTAATPDVAPGAGFNELRRHKIVDGDTLSGLAVRYLGSADRYREIFELNKDILGNPDLLPIGTELKIPALGSKVSTPGSINNRPMVPVPPRGSPAVALPGG